MLEATGITPVPGTLFGQKEGTYHFRSGPLSFASLSIILSCFIYLFLLLGDGGSRGADVGRSNWPLKLNKRLAH